MHCFVENFDNAEIATRLLLSLENFIARHLLRHSPLMRPSLVVGSFIIQPQWWPRAT